MRGTRLNPFKKINTGTVTREGRSFDRHRGEINTSPRNYVIAVDVICSTDESYTIDRSCNYRVPVRERSLFCGYSLLLRFVRCNRVAESRENTVDNDEF